ncbi:unnamed protein product [Fraxinus pennsylvanica]|uniref:Uncharacterized protein n=1 Tax=Fraxinus pennsylvanica TaxID=56036 RepID=A0AAD2EES7_9LAMI|nr:unnamed protein product [Fraxinus pennsylvanica]
MKCSPYYGRSYYDVLQGVEHILENFSRDQISAPSNFKYLIALEKQLTSTMLHMLGLASRTDHQAVQDFLVKKASFLVEWLKGLCSSLEETSSSAEETTSVASVNLKKDVISITVRSLIEVYEISNHNSVAQRSTVEHEVSTFLGLTGFTVFFKTFASGYTCGVSWINGGIKWSLHDEAVSWNFGYTYD